MNQVKRAFSLANILVALGTALLFYAVAGYAHGSLRQSELRSEWEERPVLPAPSLAGAVPEELAPDDSSLAFREGEPIGRLRIPRIGVDAVVLEGISDKTLAVAPGHYPGMAFPGQGRHSVLSAHRDSFFKDLGKLERGDRISITRWDGREIAYAVSRTYIVHKSNRTVIVPKNEELLTLITCYPFVYVGRAPYRYILEAVPVHASASSNRWAG